MYAALEWKPNKKVSKILKDNRFKIKYLIKDYQENVRCILAILNNN